MSIINYTLLGARLSKYCTQNQVNENGYKSYQTTLYVIERIKTYLIFSAKILELTTKAVFQTFDRFIEGKGLNGNFITGNMKREYRREILKTRGYE